MFRIQIVALTADPASMNIAGCSQKTALNIAVAHGQVPSESESDELDAD
jgi:hypothetical protein